MRRLTSPAKPSAGILILNWNGRELLQEHLPSVVRAATRSGLPVAIADNGSSDDSLAFLRAEYPQVITIPLDTNYGFGRGYNLAMRRVPWDIVILLNNDMTVEEDFADHLLAPFSDDEHLFAVSSQIFFPDDNALREETGRTSARFRHGKLELAHLPVPSDGDPIPVFWLGGGSAAVCRHKFKELGGFDEIYSPFYMEDVDLSFRAWQRDWPTMLAPRSRVLHRHRGSTGRLDPGFVDAVHARNRLLFVWLNVRDRRLLRQHIVRLATPPLLRRSGPSPRTSELMAALRHLPEIRRRRRDSAKSIVVTDVEVFARFAIDWLSLTPPPQTTAQQTAGRTQVEEGATGMRTTPEAGCAGSVDSRTHAPFGAPAARRPLRLLFFVPMSVYPISHGGASRIMNSIWGLARRGHEVHLLSLVANETDREAMLSVPEVASSHSYALPLEDGHFPGSAMPTAIRKTHKPTAQWLIKDLVRRYGIDILQLEYTQSGVYLAPESPVPTVLVEHDIAYRSAFRGALRLKGSLRKGRALFDVLRLYHWELETAKRADLVLSASDLEAGILRRRGVERVSSAVPNGVDVTAFEPPGPRREDRDILFIGYFLHPPNVDGLRHFLTAIWPHIPDGHSRPTVTVVGDGLTTELAADVREAGFDCPGFVPDIREELWSHRVFVCPIRFGAGTRIKLLEAAAAKCAIVSTTLGAEGLGLQDGRNVLIADDPMQFAVAVKQLLADEDLRRRLGEAAHETVRRNFDWPMLAGNLERLYYKLLEQRR